MMRNTILCKFNLFSIVYYICLTLTARTGNNIELGWKFPHFFLLFLNPSLTRKYRPQPLETII